MYFILREGLLTDKNDLPIEEEASERKLNYNPPAQKSLQEIQDLDKDDESLVKYKQTLLGPEALQAGLCVCFGAQCVCTFNDIVRSLQYNDLAQGSHKQQQQICSSQHL